MGCGETDVESAGVLFEEVTRGCSGRRNALRLYEALCIDIIAGKCRDAMHRVSNKVAIRRMILLLHQPINLLHINCLIHCRVEVFPLLGGKGKLDIVYRRSHYYPFFAVGERETMIRKLQFGGEVFKLCKLIGGKAEY